MKLTSNFLSIAAIIFCAVAALVAFFSPAVEKIEISHNSIEIEISSEFNLGLSCSPTKAELTDRVVWTTSNPEIATISDFGQVCGKAVGQATITAKYKNLTASCQVTILPIEVTGVSVSSQYSKIHPQETMQAQATIIPQTATNKTLVWASSNPEVATVSNTGLITGVMAGQATITATANNQICGSIDISVQNVIEVESIDISSQTFNTTQLKIGSYQLKYTISPQNADNFVPTWESTDPTTISVDQNGKISTHKDGSATITATTPNGKKSTLFVVVPRVEARIIYIKTSPNGSNASLHPVEISQGQTLQLYTTILADFTTGQVATTREIEWLSSDPTKVSVSENGLVCGLQSTQIGGVNFGITITARVKGVSGVFGIVTIKVV